MVEDDRNKLLERLEDCGLIVALDRKQLFGPKRYIYCYVGEDKKSEAKQFLYKLKENKRTKATAGAYWYLFKAHCSGHTLTGEKHHGFKEDDLKGIYEYKHIGSKTRIIHVTEPGGGIVLLFGFSGKKENKAPKKQIEKAKRLRNEYLERRTALLNEAKGRKR